MLQLSKRFLKLIVFGLVISCSNTTFMPVETANKKAAWLIRCPISNNKDSCYSKIEYFCHGDFKISSEIKDAAGLSYIFTCHDYNR